MRRHPIRTAFIAIPLVALLGAAQLLIVDPAVSAATPATRIMPLGDSITGNPGCWRALLWQKLKASGYTNIDMVGTQPPQGCAVSHDGDNEGHGGALVTSVADQNALPGWLSKTRPDIVIMHFGTNDVWSNRSTNTILAAYSKLVDQMRASNPRMRILVAKIIPVAPSTCPECPQRTMSLNNAIPAWAAAKTTTQSPITVVDQWTGWNAAADTSDGVHPNNESGIKKMADAWYAPLAAALNGTTPGSQSGDPTPPPDDPTTGEPTPTRCDATYRVVNQWGSGFQAEVTVKNTGTVASTGWATTFTFTDGQTLAQSWNGTATQDGAAVTITNLEWNGALGTGSAVTAGFIGSWNGSTNAAPTASCTLAS